MMRKPSRLALLGTALVCATILAACNDAPRLQFVTVAPISGQIYVSSTPVGGIKGAVRHGAHLALQSPGTTGRHPAALPPPVTAACGSLQYAATALFSDGSTQDATSTAKWTSSDTSVASISSSGLASGIGLGTTNIGATFNGVSATSEPLAVDQLNSIKVSPSTATVAQGSSVQFTAIGNFTFAAGGTSDLDVSSQVTWASSNTAVATVDNTGNATAVSAGGPINITATSCDGVMVGTAQLTVGQVAATSLVVAPATITISTGTTTLFTAMEKLSDGTTQALQHPVTWSSSTPAVATIDANTGVALGLTAGTSTTPNITATETISGLTGTAVLTVQAAAARFAYVADGQGGAGSSGTISGYSVDVTFTPPVKAFTTAPVPASSPQQVLLHPSGHLMYYINSNGFLYIDDINPGDGSFSDSKQNPVRASTSAASFNVGVIDPTGRFIYVTSSVDNSIYGFRITQTADNATNGALTAVTPTFNPYTPTPALNSPRWIMTDRAGKYVYVVNNGGNTISEFSIDQTTGALSPLPTPTIATDTGPFYGTTDVNGHLYVANQGGTPAVNSVSGYTIDTTGGATDGQLKLIGSGPFPINNATFITNVITDPTGKYLYVLDSTAGPPPATAPVSQVFAFNLTPATGVIGAQIGTAQLTGNSPTGMAIDPTGVLLAIDNNFDNSISLFTIGSSAPGGLTPTNPTTIATDTSPQFVVFYTAAKDQ